VDERAPRWILWSVVAAVVLLVGFAYARDPGPVDSLGRYRIVSLTGAAGHPNGTGQICVVGDGGNEDIGGDPWCPAGGIADINSEPVSVQVGDCVDMHNVHPLDNTTGVTPCRATRVVGAIVVVLIAAVSVVAVTYVRRRRRLAPTG